MSRVTGSKRSASAGADDDDAADAYAHAHAHPYHPRTASASSSSSAGVGSGGQHASAAAAAAASGSSSAAASASASSNYRPPADAAAGGGSPLYAPGAKSEMTLPRTSSTVSEEVWAKAIHAVKVQKMSLRQAAQLYGVHHMSLHRRVRGRYASTLPPSSDIRSFLSPDDEAEVLGVLREQFLHERRITNDDIRFVVRAIASQGGKRSIPPEFPPSRWILDFKRAHGFVKLNSYAYPPTGTSQQGDDDAEDMDDSGSNYSGYSLGSSHRSIQSRPRGRDHDRAAAAGPDQSSGRRSATASVESNYDAADREEFNARSANGSIYDGGVTTGSSSGGSYENGESEKRTYRLSHTVPPETWEKAIAAVEQQGMSLRAAAKLYGVHFAALHRRVKKRAQGEQATGIEGYFQPEDEAGIIRVVVARAELGVLMTFDELMDLAQRAALRNLPDLSVEAARKLMTRFQTRNEHSIRHIIADWPSPRTNPLTAVPRVVNNMDAAPRGGGGAGSLAPPPSAALPPSPPGMRGYASARAAATSMSELSHGRAPPLPAQQQANGELTHSPLPPLRSEFPPPPPTSSIFSRHTLHSNGVPGPPPRRVAQPMSSSAAAVAADHHGMRYLSHDDRARHERHPYDGHSSYDDDDERDRRDSGSSEGDAVMFV